MVIFEHAHPKIIESSLGFVEFLLACKKSVYSISCFLRCNQFWSPVTILATPIFDHAPPPQKFCQLLIFVNLYEHSKNKFISSAHSSDTVNLSILSPDWPHPFLIMFTPKIFNYLLICMNLGHHAKNQLIPLAYSWDTVNCRAHRPDWPQLFLTIWPNPKIFNWLFIFVNLYQQAKNEAVSSICSEEVDDLQKSSNLIGCEHFGLYLKNKTFPKHRICAGTQKNNINFHYRTNSVKINDQMTL